MECMALTATQQLGVGVFPGAVMLQATCLRGLHRLHPDRSNTTTSIFSLLNSEVYLLESLKKNNVIKMCFSSIVHPPASSSCIDHLLNAFRVLSMAQSPSSVGGVAVDVPV